jgi:hypothetical protein
MAQSEGC